MNEYYFVDLRIYLLQNSVFGFWERLEGVNGFVVPRLNISEAEMGEEIIGGLNPEFAEGSNPKPFARSLRPLRRISDQHSKRFPPKIRVLNFGGVWQGFPTIL